MSSVTTQILPERSPEPVFRLSVEQYHGMIDAGVLTDDDPVELIEGMLIQKMPKKPRHRYVVRKLFKALEAMLPEGYFVQSQEPVTLNTSEPEPDVTVIRGNDDDFVDRHPGPTEVALVIEVADTTRRRDRGIKLRAYARSGLTPYWIIDIVSRVVEIHTDPDSQRADPIYRQKVIIEEQAKLPIVLDGKQIGQLDISALLA